LISHYFNESIKSNPNFYHKIMGGISLIWKLD
jgi:hypothetical protein